MEVTTQAGEPGGRVRRGATQWQALVARQRASGLGVTAFCQREGVTLSSFRRWRARVGGNGGGQPQPMQAAPTFVDLGAWGETAPGRGGLELTLELGGGVVLRLVRS